MYSISKSSLENIKSIFKSNPVNESRYQIIDKRINTLLPDFEFAQPIIQESSGYIIWKSHNDLPYKKYGELNNDILKSKIDAKIQSSLSYLEMNLPNELLGSFLEDIIELPSEDPIYFHENNDGEIHVVLTEWGFLSDELENRQGILRKIMPKRLNSGVIWFKNNKGEAAQGIDVQFKTEKSTINDVTDKFGKIKLNKFDIHTKIWVSSSAELFDPQELNFDSEEQAHVTVNSDFVQESLAEQVELPVEQLISSYNQVESISGITNPMVILQFQDRKGRAVKKKVVDFYGSSGKINSTTDDNGEIQIEKINFGKENTVFSQLKKTDWKKDFNYNDEEKLTFTIKERRFLWWWIPLIALFFLLSLIPFEVNHYFTVLDADTHIPISDVSINGYSVGGISTLSVNNTTNLSGQVSINYGQQSLLGQLFYPKSSPFIAEKNGYHSLRGILSLGFFNYRKSVIYFEKRENILPPIVPPDSSIQPCGGGENQDENGMQIKKFDLGKANASFEFEYFNEIEVDTIIVRTDNGIELFRFEDNTRTITFQDKVMLNSPSRFIEVEVIGNSNWGIRVNCPE